MDYLALGLIALLWKKDLIRYAQNTLAFILGLFNLIKAGIKEPKSERQTLEEEIERLEEAAVLVELKEKIAELKTPKSKEQILRERITVLEGRKTIQKLEAKIEKLEEEITK